jgi:hypothetical protein
MLKTMLNPSAPGWVEKFFVKYYPKLRIHQSEAELYFDLRKTGFTYGYSVYFDPLILLSTAELSIEEKSKIGLLVALTQTQISLSGMRLEEKEVATRLAEFYETLYPVKPTIWQKFMPKTHVFSLLEKIIDTRVKTNDNVISKSFSHVLTNALVFVDVLAFEHFLKLKRHATEAQDTTKISIDLEQYLKNTEKNILALVVKSLQSKPQKTAYDDLLIKLFESSARYHSFSSKKQNLFHDIRIERIQTILEKMYHLDLGLMAIWSDGKAEGEEIIFVKSFADALGIQKDIFEKSKVEIDTFITKYKGELPYFQYSNPIKHLYDQSSSTVVMLIQRNKRRLIKEISDSKELMMLLAVSTIRDLSDKEKKKVKKQLLDVCKTIPSLTIFLLPGGSLLLPLLIKFIPALLPTAFNENQDYEN